MKFLFNFGVIALFAIIIEAQFPRRIPQFLKNKIVQKLNQTLNSNCEIEDLCSNDLTGTFRKMEIDGCPEYVGKLIQEPQLPEINLEKDCETVS